MAKTIKQNAEVHLTINAREANRMLDDQKKRVEALKKKFQELKETDPNPKKLEKLNKEIKEAEKTLKQLKNEGSQVADVLSRLDKATPKELNRTLNQLKRELNNIERGSSAWDAQMEKIRRVKAEISSLNAQMQVTTSFKDKMINFFNKWQIAVAGVTASVAGLFLASRKAVNDFAEMEEAMANTRKFCGLTEEGVKALNEEFKKMDTRTSREQLNELAQEAGRLGKTSQKDIMEYVKAADILNVALSDLGEGATGKIAKLSNIFGVEEAEGTYNAMVKIGSVVNVLSQNCTASKPYLVEFTNRLAGVGNQANMTIPQIVGLGAVLDANAQKVEASSTAISQVLTRMFVDPAKYAKVAGLNVTEFTNLLKTDANEALLQFLTALNKAGKMDVLAPMFKDMGESGSRAIQAMSTLAKHINEVRWQQKNANKAFEEGTSVLHEYEIFNNTAQASIEKAQKSIKELTVELGEKLYPVMRYVNSSASLTLRAMNIVVDFIIKYRKQIITVTSAIAAYNIVVNIATIKTKAFSAAQAVANIAMKAFNAIVKANPIGILVSALTAAAAAFMLFKSKSAEARKELERQKKDHAEWVKGLSELSGALDSNSSHQISVLENVYKAATNVANSTERRRKEAQRLIDQYPDYFGKMTTEQIMLGNAKNAYDKLKDSILEVARAKAAQAKIEENFGTALDIELANEELENQRKLQQAKISGSQMSYNTIQSRFDKKYTNYFSRTFGSKATERNELSSAKKDLEDNQAILVEIEDKIKLNNEKLKDINEANDKLKSIFKNHLSEDSEDTNNDAGDGGDYSPVVSDKEAEKQRKAQLLKDKKEFREGIQALKAEELKAMEEIENKYHLGLINYLDYIDEKKNAEKDYYDSALKFYEDNLGKIKDYDVEEDKDYQNLRLKREEAMRAYDAKVISRKADVLRRQSRIEQDELDYQFKWKENRTVQDEIALQEAKHEVQMEYMKRELDLYAVGSKEWEDLKLKMDDEANNAMLEKRKALMQVALQFQKKYDQLTAAEQYAQQRKILTYLHAQGAITIEQFRKMMEELSREQKKAMAKEKASLPGNTEVYSARGKVKKAEETYNSKKDQLDSALEKGIIDDKEYSDRLARIKEEFQAAIIDPLRNCGDEWVAMLANMYMAWDDFFKNIDNGDWMENLGNAMQATVAVMGGVMSQITGFVQAEVEIQTKAIEARYDREIEMAQGNKRLVASLEKAKEKEVAKIKEDASKKEFAMQVIQAVAQTATAAVNAYSSAAAIPMVGHIIAPIAAATAIAAGMVQVAAIKKQQEAAAANGYSEGGYTPEGGKYEVAGVVHKGEWVASQKLLKSPVTAPIIKILDDAQRTNSMPSFSLNDSNYFAGAAASMPLPAAQRAPQVVVNVPENSDAGTIQNLVLTLARLNDRLERPFVTDNTVTGDKGIKKAQDDYDRYKRNSKKGK